MFRVFLFLLIGFTGTVAVGQQIHAHNDYATPRPFFDAYDNKADYIEADVWLLNGKIVVSHERPGPNAPTLDSLYLKPIVKLFQQNQDRPSPDRSYTFDLVVDVKENPAEILPILVRLLEQNITVFNRKANPKAIQVVISGNRPKIPNFFDYPLLQFDGRPSEVYDEETLQHVALISDSFQSYSRWDGTGELPDVDREKLKRVIKRAHSDKKPVRFWAIPDNPNAWKQLKKLGVDVINTDHVAEAAKEFK